MDSIKILEQGEGILRLMPTWVARAMLTPGKRLKLHPNDLYALGIDHGGIGERWFSSTTQADNGSLTLPNEGLSFVVYGDEKKPQKILLLDIVSDLGEKLLGEAIWNKYEAWPMYSKFFDFRAPLFIHLHHMKEHAELVNANQKPESYYFPFQMNNYPGDFPLTYLGLEPTTTKDQIKHCLEIWNQGDNGISYYSKAYRLKLGTGWYIPAGILHGPGSYCTYEPQWASDVFAVFESMTSDDKTYDWNLLVKQVPEEKREDLDFLVSLIDWENNVRSDFKEEYFRPPMPVADPEEMKSQGYFESWISYGNPYVSAKELTVFPGQTVTIKDAGAYGMIMLQGHGKMGKWDVETPVLIRFGQLTNDEFFVSSQAAKEGVVIHNTSSSDPLVMLKHFAANPDAPAKPNS